VFDRFSHYCLQSMRALCAVETEVRTIGHNDIEKLEQICRENPCVVYVADSVYSTGGTIAPMQELMSLQDRYGLYLFLDEAHGTSVIGKNGRGYALETMGQINDRTILVTSLNKGFGVSGGAIMFGPRDNQLRHGGPFIFSQHVNTPTLGAIIASCKIHESPELNQLQMQLKTTIKTFDRLLPLPHANPNTPIRFVPIGDEIETIHQSRLLMDSGYYVEPDFFPIVMWGQAGLRIRLRANMTSPEIEQFCAALSEHLRKSGIPIKPSE
jgi:8-amino-7-oxononanoate synthase